MSRRLASYSDGKKGAEGATDRWKQPRAVFNFHFNSRQVIMQWGKFQKLANDALAKGDLQQAAEHLSRDRFRETITGRSVSQRLTSALVDRAQSHTSAGDLRNAWDDLMIATSVAVSKDADFVSRKKNELVELTVETAETYLAHGKASHAIRSISELNSRKILDWRADRVTRTARLLQEADELAATGRLAESVQQLEEAKNLHPELSFIESRLAANRQRQMQIRDLTSMLQEKTIQHEWQDVNLCCQKLLAIAPKFKLALDAQRHSMMQMQRKTSTGTRITQVPEKDDSFFRIEEEEDSISIERAQAAANTFLLWVDGVGGFLVCTDPRNIIGQAVPNAGISIPILGDLRRRHARIETINGQHLLQFLGTDRVQGYAVEQPLALKCGQSIGLDGGVDLKYTQKHPLSTTARIDFVSRHRTQPWSDAILLAGQSIILGPNPNNHVYCPKWQEDLILFRRNNEWFCRGKTSFEIDGKEIDSEGPINFESSISGEDFSLSLEPAFNSKANA